MSLDELTTLNNLLRANPPKPNASVEESRADFDASVVAFAPPANVHIRPGAIGGIPGIWLDTPDMQRQKVILYMHGGAYVIGHARGFAKLAAEIAMAAGISCYSIDYRLAPEHPFPAAIEDAIAAYSGLLGNGFAPHQVAFAGDSAGGGLVIGALLAIRDRGLPLPACGATISAWLDLNVAGMTAERRATTDLVLSKERLLKRAAFYLGGTPSSNPHASPILADPSGLPPLIMQAGSAEILMDDSVQFASRAASAGVRVTLEVWPGQPHDFQRFSSMLGEARQAITSMGRFISLQLSE